jgi:transcriptional regulator
MEPRHTSPKEFMGDRYGLRGDLVQGTLDMLILKALTHGPMHGYSIMEFIQQTSDDVLRVEEGALYPALHRLELRGLLGADWGVSENKRRAKFYRLNAAGRKYLEQESSSWDRLSAAIARVMQTA